MVASRFAWPAHELGHNFGVYHSRGLECGTTMLGANCTTMEYGDPVDIMGMSGVVAHFNAFPKERMGRLNYGSSLPILTVQGDGTFFIEPYAAPGAGPKALKILKSVDPAACARGITSSTGAAAASTASWRTLSTS